MVKHPLGGQAAQKRMQLEFIASFLTPASGPFPIIPEFEYRFDRVGVYAIYYIGNLPIYQSIRSVGATLPIYVGSTITDLLRRINDHLNSLNESTLDPQDFVWRFWPTERVLAKFLEDTLLDYFHPVWNFGLRGFGNHMLGSKRQNQTLANFDAFHRPQGPAGKISRVSTQTLTEREMKALCDEIIVSRRTYEQTMELLMVTRA